MPGAGAVVIVTGPPGSGKTSLCRALADGEARSAHVEGDWFFRFLRSGFIQPWMSESAKQNAVVMDITCDAVAGYASAGMAVFWDGIVGPWFLDRVLDRLKYRDVTPSYVVLRPSLETATARVIHRDGDRNRSGVDRMYPQFQDLGAYERHVVAADGPLDEIIPSVRKMLDEGALLLRPSQ
jgi:adenylate kinase family enzyme